MCSADGCTVELIKLGRNVVPALQENHGFTEGRANTHVCTGGGAIYRYEKGKRVRYFVMGYHDRYVGNAKIPLRDQTRRGYENCLEILFQSTLRISKALIQYCEKDYRLQ